jgi:colanic acid/amylovoran biosynthesis glycosyltransferase
MGRLDTENVKLALAKSHIYIQYSVQEGFCNAVLEAQAMGLLCIVSDAEGLAENILDKETGWVVPKRNPELLALKIKDVFDLSETKKEQIRNSAILRVQQHFNIEKQHLEFIHFYKE